MTKTQTNAELFAEYECLITRLHSTTSAKLRLSILEKLQEVRDEMQACETGFSESCPSHGTCLTIPSSRTT